MLHCNMKLVWQSSYALWAGGPFTSRVVTTPVTTIIQPAFGFDRRT